MSDWGAVRAVLTQACAEKVFPGAAAEVGTSAGLRWRTAAGATSYAESARPVDADTVYDLASLTKVIATTTVALRLFDAGRLHLDARVSDVVLAWQGQDRSSATIGDLLEHASGLPDWRPLFREARGREAFVAAVAATPLSCPPRTRSVYSDLGFILLGWILEATAGATLDALTASALADGIGQDVAEGLRFGAPPAWRARLAPTTAEDERGRLEPGDVDDTNAWALGGVAGHAGMFGAVGPAGAFCAAMLRAARGDTSAPRQLASPSAVSRFLRRSHVAGSSRALGWDLMLPTSSCGSRMSEAAFGHTGFTGTSMWIDPKADVYCVLLSNRVHPCAGDPEGIRRVRRAFHDAVMEAC